MYRWSFQSLLNYHENEFFISEIAKCLTLIKADEVVIPLSRLEQTDEELEENLTKFIEKTPMGKQMTKLYRTDDDEGGDDKKKKKK